MQPRLSSFCSLSASAAACRNPSSVKPLRQNVLDPCEVLQIPAAWISFGGAARPQEGQVSRKADQDHENFLAATIAARQAARVLCWHSARDAPEVV